MSPVPSQPLVDFQDEQLNTTRNEILDLIDKSKVHYDSQFIGGVKAVIPTYVDFASLSSYSKSDKSNVLRGIKSNIAGLMKQVASAFDKMDAVNKSNVQTYITRIVITNVPGKASTSKKSSFSADGTLEVGTIFEDAINCSYYVEKKIITALNEFRPSQGAVVPDKVAAFEPAPTSEPSPAIAAAISAPPPVSASGLDLSQPTYPVAAQETLKLEILSILKPVRIESVVLGKPAFEMPIYVDWASMSLSPDVTSVLRSVKTNIPNIVKQIVPSLTKVDEVRKAAVGDYLVSMVVQNVPGKASTSKKACLTHEGMLIITLPLEDSLNCSYYLDKKITTALNEFIPQSGYQPQEKFISPPVAVVAPAVVQAVAQPVIQQQRPPVVYQQQPPAVVYQQQPVQQPKPVAVAPPAPVPVPIAEPKEKGRPEMEYKPTFSDPAQQFLVREIDQFLNHFKLVDDKDVPIGAPIYLDWASIMVYPTAVKQSTVLRNVNLTLYRMLRETVNAVKLSCTDFAMGGTIRAYLRSMTFQNIQGVSTTAKKVLYEDGHLIIQTVFEDLGNCAMYFDSKVIQAFPARPSTPTPKKPEQAQLIREELDIRLLAHRDVTAQEGGHLLVPPCPVTMDWSFQTNKAYESAGIEPNLIGTSNPIMTDLLGALSTFNSKEVEILRREITKIVFVQAAPGKTMFEKRSVVMADDGTLNIISIFEDRTEGGKGFRDRFINSFKARLYKVQIRDTIIPAIAKSIDESVRSRVKDNYLDKIVVPSDASYQANVVFNWTIIEKESPESQVNTYRAVTEKLGVGHGFAEELRKAICDICSYDVGKSAFLATNRFVLTNIMNAKQETNKFSCGNTWELTATFHDPANNRNTSSSMNVYFKEQLKVAFPCAIQDTFPQIASLVDELASATSKKVPVVMNYDSWRTYARFTNDQFAYKSIKSIAVTVPGSGLRCVTTLCRDAIVKKEYCTKVNSINIEYDVTDQVKKQRNKDPNVVATLDSKTGCLTFKLNFVDGLLGEKMPSWDYQFELALGTRPLKIARSMENNKAELSAVSSEITSLIGKTVQVSVNYKSFIDHRNFLHELEEPVYTKIIASFAQWLRAGWVKHDQTAELTTYATVKESLQRQLTSIQFHLCCENNQREVYDFELKGTELNVSINLSGAIDGKTMPWRITLEGIFKLRNLKIKEEIAKRIDLSKNKALISKMVGKNIELVIDWASLESDSAFSTNVDDYITYMHRFAEEIPSRFPTQYGFGELVEYQEVQQTIQTQVDTMKIVATSSGLVADLVGRTLEIHVGVRNINKFLKDTADDFECYGREVENALGLRLQIVRGYIKRNEPKFLQETIRRLTDAVENVVRVEIDWESIIQHAGFLKYVDFKPVLANILKLPAQLHPVQQLCRENLAAKKALSIVPTYTFRVDGTNSVNESEFCENKFGVDWVRASYFKPPAKDHILITVNVGRMIMEPCDLELEDKIEFLVTPDLAEERYLKKLARKDREDDLAYRRKQSAREDAYHQEQMRMDQRMLDSSNQRNRELSQLNRKLSRW
ncbi:hypothetical protein SAMD00019534_101670 [Acytostelium subglobosum LB1]|uniref:hypothetical protein n=1 Tax=Acytostelium subglobosum LB1 TaxID=1410327 RepID=UPI0006450CDE|nr:hypothetical protein SAMD00019534_101670 [Acytostelium subglobosum LB1]GAM26992.1 hypothetical protein SAMD00019534_101670 [Acytostelium subglobosum LB1]|eukprot:XP_012749872.1 hypothetical protein SAMD00019534_101670 [Acytostelium subglobosum LB1]